MAFYNHTVTENGQGSRLIMNRYYFRPPAPLDFCSMPSLPPFESYECGVTGEDLVWFFLLFFYSRRSFQELSYFVKHPPSFANIVLPRLLGVCSNLLGTKS